MVEKQGKTGKQLILFPENLNVFLGGTEENIEIRKKQN